MSGAAPTADRRPPIWAGHVGPLVVDDLDAAIAFYVALGLRPAARTPDLASLELRGGTHLVLRPDPGGGPGPADPVEAPFDLMVDDLPATRARLIAAGLDPGPIERRGNHGVFVVTDPDGHRVAIRDSHVVGIV